MKLKNGRYIVFYFGTTLCFRDDVKANDEIIGWSNNRDLWRPLQQTGINTFTSFSPMEAIKIILANGWDELQETKIDQRYLDFQQEYRDFIARRDKCECGSEKTNAPGHSHWCPKYVR